MVENYLSAEEVNKLEDIMPLYTKNRITGTNAGDISDATGIPLKDVISYFIEQKIIQGQEVDLELIRVMITKNPELRKELIRKTNTPFAEIDRALAMNDEKALRQLGCDFEFEQNYAYSIIPQVLIIGGLVNLPIAVIFSACLTVAGIICMQISHKNNECSGLEIVTRMLEEC